MRKELYTGSNESNTYHVHWKKEDNKISIIQEKLVSFGQRLHALVDQQKSFFNSQTNEIAQDIGNIKRH